MNQYLLTCPPPSPPAKQGGAVLIIGLVLLVALTIIGISALTSTSLEHRMAGNMGDTNQAFNAAETAGRAMQQITVQLTVPPAEQNDCKNTAISVAPLCVWKKQADNWWEGKDHSWWLNNTTLLDGAGQIKNVKTPPRAVVENLQYIPDSLVVGLEYVTKGTQYYRITSRGTGYSDESQAVVQQTTVKRFN